MKNSKHSINRRRKRKCNTKRGYDKRYEAIAAIIAISAKKGYRRGYLSFYECHVCHKWHLSTNKTVWPYEDGFLTGERSEA